MKRILLLTLGAVVVFVLALQLGGINTGSLLVELVRSSVGTPFGIGGTLRETTPLLICGIAVYVALRAGLFNIGVEGQFAMGALAAAAAGVAVPGPASILAALIAGTLAGALWSLPAGLIRAYRSGHEVITTIMLNQVAVQLSVALMSGPLQAKGATEPTTAEITHGIPLLWKRPDISPVTLLAAAGTFALGWWLFRTVKGYELRAVGASPRAAAAAGIETKSVLWRSLTLSGAIGGLGGALQVLAFDHRCYSGFSAGYGFDALGVALLAGQQPLFMIVSALVFGALKEGFASVGALMSVPKGISTFLLGLVIIVLAAFRYRSMAEREVEG